MRNTAHVLCPIQWKYLQIQLHLVKILEILLLFSKKKERHLLCSPLCW